MLNYLRFSCKLLNTNIVSCNITYCLIPLQLTKVAKRLKKEKVNVDIVSFGEEVSITVIFF